MLQSNTILLLFLLVYGYQDFKACWMWVVYFGIVSKWVGILIGLDKLSKLKNNVHGKTWNWCNFNVKRTILSDCFGIKPSAPKIAKSFNNNGYRSIWEPLQTYANRIDSNEEVKQMNLISLPARGVCSSEAPKNAEECKLLSYLSRKKHNEPQKTDNRNRRLRR